MAYVGAQTLRRPGAGISRRVPFAGSAAAPRAMLFRRVRYRLPPRQARYALTVGAGTSGAVQAAPVAAGGAVTGGVGGVVTATATSIGKAILPASTPTIGSTIGGGLLNAGLTALQGGSGKQVLEATGKTVAVQAVATAALAIPVVGPVVSGIISLIGPSLVSKLGHKGLGSGCSPDEPTLPHMEQVKLCTPYQATAWANDHPDRLAYYQKCGGVWGATLQSYISWYYWTYYVGGDQVGKGWPPVKSPFDYPPEDPAIAAQIQAQQQQQAMQAQALAMQQQQQQQQYELQAAQLQLQAQAQANAQQAAQAQKAAELKQQAEAEVLRAQAQVTSAAIAGQSQQQEAAQIAAGQAAAAQASAAAAQSKSLQAILQTAVAARQSAQREAEARAAAAAKTAGFTQGKTVALVVAVLAIGATIVVPMLQKRGRRRRGSGRSILATA